MDDIETDSQDDFSLRYPLQPVRLISGLIYSDETLRDRAIDELISIYGDIKAINEPAPFTHTSYYRKEMGGHLLRQFISFKRLVDSDSLANIKIFTNKIETFLADSDTQKRRINIDPGYLALEKLVLATTKNYSHRIHLSKGIYAELTYRFSNKSYTTLEWTYPDYIWDDTIVLFNSWRDEYIEDLNGR